MSYSEIVEDVRDKGFFTVDSVFTSAEVLNLREQLDEVNRQSNLNVRSTQDLNMVHNCHEKSLDFLGAFEHPLIVSTLNELLGHSYIIYAFQSSTLPPNATNSARRIHCDSPRLIQDYITNVGVIIALNDYTQNSGSIEFMPYSFRIDKPPSDSEFVAKSKKVECREGSVIIFNARTFHREGINMTQSIRHSLTCNFCRCYMRQRFDFVRMAQSSGSILAMTSHQRKLIGYNVRMPTSLDEFFLPDDQRMYLSGQE